MKLRFFFSIIFVLAETEASAELSIQITQGVDNPIPIAVVPFSMDSGIVLSEDVAGIVRNDLEQVGEFRTLSLSNMISLPDEEQEVFYRDWRILAQDYLLVGKIDQAPGSQLVQVQYEFFDVNRDIKLAGEVLTGSLTQLRDIGHTISNVVFEQVTGVPGAFTSQLLYIVAEGAGPSTSLFKLEKSDYDGARPQVLLESGAPIMSPSWSPNGQDVAYVSFETGLPRIYIQNIMKFLNF